ncbi:MAG: hypothetical protein H6702_05510 [Myxococcales bacterium]|nr:hypothetical protein [Myxococcales bacterium]
MADPLIPPWPGMVPGPPWGPVRHLWAAVEAPDAAGLRQALAHLRPALAHHTEVRVRYPALDPALAAVHSAWVAETGADGAAPWCLSPLPGQRAAAQAVATPPDCAGCLLYQPGRCPGLGQAPRPWAEVLPQAPPLRPVPPLADLTDADFAGDHPVGNWRPAPADIDRLAQAAGRAGGRVVDLGGGNGLFAALLAARGLAVTVVDPNGNGPTAPGVRRIVAPAAEAVAHLQADAVLISWPPTGVDLRGPAEALDPAVLLLAHDGEGLCGRTPGQAGVVARPDGLTWFRWPAADDFAPAPHRPLQATWRVPSYRSLVAGHAARDGVVAVHAPFPVPVV